MSKRSADQAIRDDIVAQRAVLARLRTQEETRLVRAEVAKDDLAATREAIDQTIERIRGLEAALAALISLPIREEDGHADA